MDNIESNVYIIIKLEAPVWTWYYIDVIMILHVYLHSQDKLFTIYTISIMYNLE